MAEKSGAITKLEWVTCPYDSATFQIAVPAQTREIRISRDTPFYQYSHYCLDISCPQCKLKFWIETNLPAHL